MNDGRDRRRGSRAKSSGKGRGRRATQVSRSRQAARARRAAQSRAGRRVRVRPRARAAAHEARVRSRPMPRPPARRPAARPRTVPAPQADDLSLRVAQVRRVFSTLEARAQMGHVYQAIGDIDARLTQYPLALDELRERGYVHSGELEDLIEAIDDRWAQIRPRVETTLRAQVTDLDREMDRVEQQLNRLATNVAAVATAETAVSSLSNTIRAAEGAVSGLYDGMGSELDKVGWQIGRLSQMLDRLEESSNIRLREAEGPLMVAEATWQGQGDEGPQGLLLLTDQRLIFEQREEVVTKRTLGIFAAESETVSKVLLDEPVASIDSAAEREEGGFLGLGKDEILDLVFAAGASVSRARFHLQDQDSAAWTVFIRRIQTGEIDEDRAEEYIEEMEVAEAVAAALPTMCPNCFANLPVPARGMTSVTCEYCGSVLTAELAPPS